MTIASGGGRDVSVLQGGRRVAPTHPVGAHTMQEIIPHYLALGIDRFAYAGHGCLKASLTTAALVRAPDSSWRHFITMYAVVTVARTMPVDKKAQLLGRFNTDMGDYKFPRGHSTWILTNEGVVEELQSYRDFEFNIYRFWAADLTLGELLARCQRSAPQLDSAIVGARRHKLGEFKVSFSALPAGVARLLGACKDTFVKLVRRPDGTAYQQTTPDNYVLTIRALFAFRILRSRNDLIRKDANRVREEVRRHPEARRLRSSRGSRGRQGEHMLRERLALRRFRAWLQEHRRRGGA